MSRDPSIKERVVLVGLAHSRSEVEATEESLDELAQLADTAGAEAVGRVVQVRDHPDPATYLGKGKAREVVEQARMLKADAIIFDDELAPAQGRNLEDMAGVNPLAEHAMKIIDRTGLILDVFSQHAQSSEGKLQVELAQISYMVPRLRGWGDVMSRIGGSAGPGIGTRGPGETKLEVDRRRIQRRLVKLKKDLRDLERTRQLKRKGRIRAGVAQVSLVGYTNAGKSSLLNALTGAGVLVEDKLFSTLDPTARRLEIPDGREVVLIDTVGFVRKLPHQLIESFRSTLEETLVADLMIHVVDGTRSEPSEQIAAVESVLGEIRAEAIPRLLVLNKSDAIDAEHRERLGREFPDARFVSALTGAGTEELLTAVSERLRASRVFVSLRIPFDRGDLVSALHDQAEIIDESHSESGTRLVARVPAEVLPRYLKYVVAPDPDATNPAD